MEENRIIEENEAPAATNAEEDVEFVSPVEEEEIDAEETLIDEREEYEALIKKRFKDFYAEDTQRLINRRFRKYKVMEERYRLLEETLAEREAQIRESEQRYGELEKYMRDEIERAVRETEERILGDIRAKRLRPFENGASPRTAGAPVDVSRLTKSERATLAGRAARGEKIKF